MKIHSDFRDYYDIGLSVGVDLLLHYNRKEKGIDVEEVRGMFPEETINKVRYTCNSDGPDVQRVLIGFCGTIYPCIRVIRSERDVDNLYSPERLDTVFKLTVPSWGRPSENWERNHRKEQRERANFLVNRPRIDGLFLKIDAPIFIAYVERGDRYQEVRITTNKILKPYDFAKVKDPFTAFQEISMYLGNELVKHDQPNEIADEYRIAMHGYDKHSFRHPTRVSHL